MSVNTNTLIVSPLTASSQLVDPKTGIPTAYGQVALQRMITALNSALTLLGEFNGIIGTGATIQGQVGTVAAKVQHLGATGNLNAINLTGVVAAAQLPAAVPLAQGAVQLPTGAVSNVLGSAALEPTTSFDPAGAAATAQTNAETFATAAANTAQTNAESFASNASNLSSGTVPNARLSGLTVTITTAQLTTLGAQGSMIFTNGLLTAQTPAT